jgi:hypothetical protein
MLVIEGAGIGALGSSLAQDPESFWAKLSKPFGGRFIDPGCRRGGLRSSKPHESGQPDWDRGKKLSP